MVLTNKTNQWIGVKTAEHISWMKKHLDESFNVIKHERLTEMFAEANALS